MSMTANPPSGLLGLFNHVKRGADAAGVFGDISISNARLICPAKAAAEPAFYRIELADSKLWVSLVTPNRWLSESIEADLMHTGDDLEELIEEELVEHGCEGLTLPFEHFRSEDRLFTFRSPMPFDPEHADQPANADLALKCLLAYEACFRRLGDMEAADDEE